MTYATISIEDLDEIIFSEVIETSAETIRKNLASTEFALKWHATPSFISDGTVTPLESMNYAEALTLMATPAWKDPNPY